MSHEREASATDEAPPAASIADGASAAASIADGASAAASIADGASPAASIAEEPLLTPVFLAREDGRPAGLRGPEPSVYYVLASNGLFLVRNHRFFRSTVPAPTFPSELGEHTGAFEPRFPRIPQLLFERIVGFFTAVARTWGAEAGVLLCWDTEEERVHVVAPPQVATVTIGAGGRGTPIGLHYTIPPWLPPSWVVFGDVHSHATLPAFASETDKHDETWRPGLHVVVGEIDREPPGFHVEAVVDEQRFAMTIEEVIEGYAQRRTSFPPEWPTRLRVLDVRDTELDADSGTDSGAVFDTGLDAGSRGRGGDAWSGGSS